MVPFIPKPQLKCIQHHCNVVYAQYTLVYLKPRRKEISWTVKKLHFKDWNKWLISVFFFSIFQFVAVNVSVWIKTIRTLQKKRGPLSRKLKKTQKMQVGGEKGAKFLSGQKIWSLNILNIYCPEGQYNGNWEFSLNHFKITSYYAACKMLSSLFNVLFQNFLLIKAEYCILSD